MGALTPILFQGAVPVFADVDPASFNVTAESIERVLSPRTRAIIVTHLFGNPREMSAIMELADSRGIPVIEDCAQAYGALSQGHPVGTLGSIGCFSLQQGKHVTTGEGGLLVTRDAAFARRIFLFINKAWGYGDEKPDHYFAALNYRMNELTGAVALQQMGKLKDVVSTRMERAERLRKSLDGCAGLETPRIADGDAHSYWKYTLSVAPDTIDAGPGGMAQALKEYGIASAPRYIQKPAFECEVFREQRTFGSSGFPFSLARPEALDYSPELFPGTYEALRRVLVLPWNERYLDSHVDFIAEKVKGAAKRLRRGGS